MVRTGPDDFTSGHVLNGCIKFRNRLAGMKSPQTTTHIFTAIIRLVVGEVIEIFTGDELFSGEPRHGRV